MMQKVLQIVILVVHYSVINSEETTDNPIVSTPLGSIQGSVLTSVREKPIYSFRGIRYAQPPINELRFQPPVPVEKWNDIYNATVDGPLCPQPELTPISEDCLRLNVYTTKLPNGKTNPKRPVFVFFHPGGFYSSGGTSVSNGPQYFLDEDIVLVTLNYRLGSLGFLSTRDKLAPGNNGLKDQVMALRWVKDNIAAFGGDPNLVTIFGYSAGGSSVTLHLVSPMSKGLFHRAIAMSGSSLGNWPVKTHQFELAQKQARFLNCPDDTSANIINCLKTKTAEEIGNTLYSFDEFAYDPILIWLPVIEPDFGQERFLTEDPVKSVQCGKFEKVPFMTGVTTEEFSHAALNVLENSTWLAEMDQEFDRVAPIAFIYERDTEHSKLISKQLRKFYLGDGSLSNSSRDGIGKLYADGVIGFGVNRAAKLLAQQNTAHTYYYLFSYEGRYSYYYLPDTETPDGAVHHDDLLYIFSPSFFPRFNVTDPEYSTVQKLTKMLKNFAVAGNPTPELSEELDNVRWTPFTNENNKYLDIGQKLIVKENLFADRYAEWEALFPLPHCDK